MRLEPMRRLVYLSLATAAAAGFAVTACKSANNRASVKEDEANPEAPGEAEAPDELQAEAEAANVGTSWLECATNVGKEILAKSAYKDLVFDSGTATRSINGGYVGDLNFHNSSSRKFKLQVHVDGKETQTAYDRDTKQTQIQVTCEETLNSHYPKLLDEKGKELTDLFGPPGPERGPLYKYHVGKNLQDCVNQIATEELSGSDYSDLAIVTNDTKKTVRTMANYYLLSTFYGDKRGLSYYSQLKLRDRSAHMFKLQMYISGVASKNPQGQAQFECSSESMFYQYGPELIDDKGTIVNFKKR